MRIRLLILTLFFIALSSTAVPASDHQRPANGGGGLGSSIQVHGHWTIAVLEPDGQKVREVSFNNALVGASVLAVLLGADAVTGGMYMEIDNQNGGSGPCNNLSCEIVPSGMNPGITPESTDMTVSFVGTNFETLRLYGSVTATSTTTLDQVTTWSLLCNKTDTVADCRANPDSASVLTRKTLGSGVSVTAGQIIQVTVDLTFS